MPNAGEIVPHIATLWHVKEQQWQSNRCTVQTIMNQKWKSGFTFSLILRKDDLEIHHCMHVFFLLFCILKGSPLFLPFIKETDVVMDFTADQFVRLIELISCCAQHSKQLRTIIAEWNFIHQTLHHPMHTPRFSGAQIRWTRCGEDPCQMCVKRESINIQKSHSTQRNSYHFVNFCFFAFRIGSLMFPCVVIITVIETRLHLGLLGPNVRVWQCFQSVGQLAVTCHSACYSNLGVRHCWFWLAKIHNISMQVFFQSLVWLTVQTFSFMIQAIKEKDCSDRDFSCNSWFCSSIR